MKKSIGILGGMGALATADLFAKIVNMTKAECDADHIRIYIDNNPLIPDRTEAILAKGEDPLPYMTDSLRNLEKCGADCIIMPCNTAHFFLPRLQGLTHIPFLSMLNATADAALEKFPQKKAAVLATKGTLSSGLYSNTLNDHGIDFILPNEKEKDTLMRVIYDGIKAGKPPTAYENDMISVINGLTDRGADYFILGCTELPIASQALNLTVPVIDPTFELAKSAIEFCGYQIK